MKLKTAGQDLQAGECAVKFLFQKHKRMVQIGFEQQPFFFFRSFPLITGCHSVRCCSTASCFQCPSPLHQLYPYPPSLHPEIFSLTFLFPGNSISISLLPTYSCSLLMTCPYHLSLPSLIFIPNRSILTVPLMYSFLILSFLVTPIANLNIFISATSTSSICFFCNRHSKG